ncbi:hypothetical protein BH09VER1_BH09VER1_45550 [soil metagenome]
MDAKKSQGTAQDSPATAASVLRRSAQAIRKSAKGLGQHRAEYLALIDWAKSSDLILPFEYIEQFSFIGDGAEHRVYKDDAQQKLAIKATHANRFGYSTEFEGWATPIEYLRRLAAQNSIFGDDLKIIGVIYSEGHVEIVTSQPWISVHKTLPNPRQDEIDIYMGDFGFQALSFDLDTPL